MTTITSISIIISAPIATIVPSALNDTEFLIDHKQLHHQYHHPSDPNYTISKFINFNMTTITSISIIIAPIATIVPSALNDTECPD